MRSISVRAALGVVLAIGMRAPEVVSGFQAKRPPVAGYSEFEANVTIWFVDNDRTVATWNDGEKFTHPALRRMLDAAGMKTRVEHISQAELAVRWKDAESDHRLPDLLSATNWAGTVRALEKEGRLKPVVSERLSFLTEHASCADFALRFLHLVRDSVHPSLRDKAVEVILKLGPTFELPGRHLSAREKRLEAEHAARRAVKAFLSGDPAGLRLVASSRSSHLHECSRPAPSLKGMNVEAGTVELRGNALLAVAVVDTTFKNDRCLGSDPVVVILVREDSRWKALTVCRDVLTLTETVPKLCKLLEQTAPNAASPAAPRLLEPADGGNISREHPHLRWALPDQGGAVAAQVYEQHLGNIEDKEASWPNSMLQVFPAQPREGKVNPFEGVIGARMSWTVWAIGQDGQIAIAPTAHFGLGR